MNQKAHDPSTDGDRNVEKVMLSDSIVELMKTKEFQNYAKSVFLAFLALGSQIQPSSAVPVEYGEAAAEAIKNAGQAAEAIVGDFAGKVTLNQQLPQGLPEAGKLMPPNLGHLGQAGNLGFHQANPGGFGPNFNPNGVPNANRPAANKAWRLPGPPRSAAGQSANTLFRLGSVGWIC